MQKWGFMRCETRGVLTWQHGHMAALAGPAQTHVGAYVAHRLTTYRLSGLLGHGYSGQEDRIGERGAS